MDKIKMNQQMNHAEEILKRNGYRTTLPRKAILEIIVKSKDHLTAKDIYLIINKKHSNVGLTTVHRTLDLLVRLKLLSRFEFGDGHHSYELKSESLSTHHHLICSSCGKVINCYICSKEGEKFFEQIQEIIAQQYSFQCEDFSVQVNGLCYSCNQ